MSKLPNSYKVILLIAAMLVLFLSVDMANLISAKLAKNDIEVVVRNADIYDLTDEQRIEDIDFLYSFLKENYPLFSIIEKKYNYNWLSDKKKFEDWALDSNNAQEYYEVITRILTLLQDRHTGIIAPHDYEEYLRLYEKYPNNVWNAVLGNDSVREKYSKWSKVINDRKYIVPIVFSYVEGKYAVINGMENGALKKLDIPLGSELTKVNTERIDEYLEDKMDTYLLTVDKKRNKPVADNLILTDNKQGTYQLTFLAPSGESIDRSIQSVLYDVNNQITQKNFDTKIIKEDKIAYVKFRSFQDDRIKNDSRELNTFFQQIMRYPFLIIDIRGNSGGNVAYWKDNIINQLSDRVLGTEYFYGYKNGEYINRFINIHKSEIESPDTRASSVLFDNNYNFMKRELRTTGLVNSSGFHGQIYLLTDRKVYSAAEYLAYFAKGTSWATLVGTETGGGMNPEPMVFVLPNSGLIISFTAGIGISNDGVPDSLNGITPDIYAEQSYSDLLKDIYGDRTFENGINPYDTMLKKVLDIIGTATVAANENATA